jgi:hypothetical protein
MSVNKWWKILTKKVKVWWILTIMISAVWKKQYKSMKISITKEKLQKTMGIIEHNTGMKV